MFTQLQPAITYIAEFWFFFSSSILSLSLSIVASFSQCNNPNWIFITRMLYTDVQTYVFGFSEYVNFCTAEYKRANKKYECLIHPLPVYWYGVFTIQLYEYTRNTNKCRNFHFAMAFLVCGCLFRTIKTHTMQASVTRKNNTEKKSRERQRHTKRICY